MALELLDESRIKKTGVRPDIKIDLDDIDKNSRKVINEKETKFETKIDTKQPSSVKKIELKIIKKENIKICERRNNGMTDNCTLCKALNHETFNRCANKWL